MLKYSFSVFLVAILWVSINPHPIADPRDQHDLPPFEIVRGRFRRSGFFPNHQNPMGSPSIGAGILNPLSAGAFDPSLNPALTGGIVPGGGLFQGSGIIPGGGINYQSGILPGTLTGTYPYGTQYGTNVGVPLGGHRVQTAVGITGGGGGGGGGGSGGGGWRWPEISEIIIVTAHCQNVSNAD